MDITSLHDLTQSNVVLLHGLGRTYRINNRLESYLRQQGYNVFNIDYPSKKCSVKDCAELVYEQIKHLYHLDQPIHFVGHSMGALVTRYLIYMNRPRNLGRVVLLGPPNHGTQIAGWLHKTFIIPKIMGPALLELSVGKKGVWRELPPMDYEVGIIAGDLALDLFFWLLLDKPNDGKVSVHSTRVREMTDFITVSAAHTFLPSNKQVKKQVAYFLENGFFYRS